MKYPLLDLINYSLASMDGNSAKKAPVLDHLVGTTNAPTGNKSAPSPQSPSQAQTQAHTQVPSSAKPVLASMNGANHQSSNPAQQASNPQTENLPQNRRTDKSEFEIELARTVNKIMLKHFEHASEQIVSQVLSEVRARLPGRRKS